MQSSTRLTPRYWVVAVSMGAIHRAAGPQLLAACRRLHGCRTGEITPGFALPVAYVIHTVSPVYRTAKNPAQLLAACYLNSLNLAASYRLRK